MTPVFSPTRITGNRAARACNRMNSDDQEMATIAVKRCDTYHQPDVDNCVRELFRLLGGVERFVRKGTKVLLKPNLLAPGHPDKARTTHPAVVMAVAGLVRGAGGFVRVGDSPAVKAGRLVARTNGLFEACRRNDIPLVDFDKSAERKNIHGKRVKRFLIAEAVAEADLVINLPKIKTHSLTTFTCAVKNNFGCVVGLKKGQYHVRFDNVEDFSTMLLDLYQCIRPGLTIVDGIVSMHGKGGPSNGDPLRTGLLLAGTDCVALDIYLCRVLGIDARNVPTNRVAIRENYGVTDISKMNIIGDPAVFDGRFDYVPSDRNAAWGLPGWAVRGLNNRLSARPRVNDRCTGCGDCQTICPVGAIAVIDRKQCLDTKKCIRCYCCQEICPHNAIDLVRPLWGRWLGL